MLNWIALGFEVVGFTLAVIGIYYPERETAIEAWLDNNDRVWKVTGNLANKYWEFTSGIFPWYFVPLFSLFMICVVWIEMMVVVLLFVFFFGHHAITWAYLGDLAIPTFWAACIFFIAMIVLMVLYDVAVFLLSLLLIIPIRIADSLHPRGSAIGGAGLIIAGCGLSIDFIQAVMGLRED